MTIAAFKSFKNGRNPMRTPKNYRKVITRILGNHDNFKVKTTDSRLWKFITGKIHVHKLNQIKL